MIGNLFSWVGSLPTKVFKKSDVKDEIDEIYSSIRVSVKPTLKLLLGLAKAKDINLVDIKFFKGTPVAKEFKTVHRLLAAIMRVVDSIDSNRAKLEVYMKNMPATVSTKGMTTNDALALNVLDTLSSFMEITSDITVYVAEAYNNQDEPVFTDKVTIVKSYLLYDYYNIVVDYTDFDSVLVDLNSIVISNPQIAEAMLADKQLKIPLKNFIGNPLYHFKLWRADKQLAAKKSTELKKEYVELLLAELELKQLNQFNPELEKSIEAAKLLINQYEVKIEKLSK